MTYANRRELWTLDHKDQPGIRASDRSVPVFCFDSGASVNRFYGEV